jgi:hypothetical protein
MGFAAFPLWPVSVRRPSHPAPLGAVSQKFRRTPASAPVASQQLSPSCPVLPACRPVAGSVALQHRQEAPVQSPPKWVSLGPPACLPPSRRRVDGYLSSVPVQTRRLLRRSDRGSFPAAHTPFEAFPSSTALLRSGHSSGPFSPRREVRTRRSAPVALQRPCAFRRAFTLISCLPVVVLGPPCPASRCVSPEGSSLRSCRWCPRLR